LDEKVKSEMNKIDLGILEDIVPQFHAFLQTEGVQWREERQEKDRFFAKYFSEAEIDNLEEGTLRELIHILWAFNGWTNKDWLLEEMLRSGLPEIRTAFRQLLFGDAPVAKRFDLVKTKVRMMGAACVSEILAHHDHEKYPIWNSRSRQGLASLGIHESLLPKSAQISGSQYANFCKLVQDVRNQIVVKYPEFSDLFELDFLLYFVSLHEWKVETPGPIPVPSEDFDHGAVIDQVLELGDGLGFEVQKEFSVMRGCRIDAIWRSRVANLGTIAYAFEVHRKGSRDSAILNLQRVRRDPTIQKVVVVSSQDELEKFKSEIASLDEGFRTSVGYFEVHDLQRALDHLQGLKGILRTLGLLSSEGLFD
jgi:hypothetical protein